MSKNVLRETLMKELGEKLNNCEVDKMDRGQVEEMIKDIKEVLGEDAINYGLVKFEIRLTDEYISAKTSGTDLFKFILENIENKEGKKAIEEQIKKVNDELVELQKIIGDLIEE